MRDLRALRACPVFPALRVQPGRKEQRDLRVLRALPDQPDRLGRQESWATMASAGRQDLLVRPDRPERPVRRASSRRIYPFSPAARWADWEPRRAAPTTLDCPASTVWVFRALS